MWALGRHSQDKHSLETSHSRDSRKTDAKLPSSKHHFLITSSLHFELGTRKNLGLPASSLCTRWIFPVEEPRLSIAYFHFTQRLGILTHNAKNNVLNHSARIRSFNYIIQTSWGGSLETWSQHRCFCNPEPQNLGSLLAFSISATIMEVMCTQSQAVLMSGDSLTFCTSNNGLARHKLQVLTMCSLHLVFIIHAAWVTVPTSLSLTPMCQAPPRAEPSVMCSY